ncbi:hypothetical protein HYH03_008771 [Edaphochlamys debaryana]|uniref:Uncharacterized protein n=1 Tax=Edaphochlamys debaryana TaxID=47281 RepID=A0A836BZ75_9CHLO|nr:hypothetical protein HYH03_008771 [Edaphochlamys debaryana]|eukprot:KAG2493108.1 hypothetical protein HYH03_008771 [Edaphochlamys debaryana]
MACSGLDVDDSAMRSTSVRDARCSTDAEAPGSAASLQKADAAVQTEWVASERQAFLESVTGACAPSHLGLFNVLRMLPPGVVTRNVMRRLGMREWCALRLLAREWDQQMRTEWADCTTRVLGPDCVTDLKRRHTEGPAQSLARRHPAASRLTLLHRRLERLVLPNTSAVGSSGLLEMPPVVVDDSPQLSEALQWALEGFAPRLRALRLESDAVAVSELDLELLSHYAPALTELRLRFDVCERPAPALEALAGLAGLRRLGVALGNHRLNYDPVPERMVRSLSALPRLSALSLELTTTELPLPTASPALQGLTSLRLAVIFRGYSAGQQSAQLRGLVSQLAELTRLRALAVPDGYRGSDGDLLRAAAPVLPSLTALHLPRLSATRPELEALARLPLLQHVTLGSIDVAPDEDYQDLIPYDYANNRYGTVDSLYGAGTHGGFNATGSSLLSPTTTARLAAGGGRAEGSLGDPLGDSEGTGGWGDDGVGGSWRDGGLSGGSWKDEEGSSPRGPLLHRTPNSNGGFGRLSGCGPLGDGGLGGDNGVGGGGYGYSGPGLGVLAGMGSWRHLALCGEQRMEALVAAGPLPAGLRGLSVEALRWPRGTRADLLPARAVATLRALCADLARPPALSVRLSLESLSGSATAIFAPDDPPDVDPGLGGTDSTAVSSAAPLANSPAGVAESPAASRLRVSDSLAKRVGALGCTTVREVVATACEALGSVPGLAGLRWSGLLPLLAHLGPCSMAATLRRLGQVSELEVAGGLAGCHPAASPLFLVQFARALGAMRGLRVLRLGPAAANSDALVQGTPGLLVALRPPLRVEASFLGPKDAAELRAMLEGLGANGRGQAGATGTLGAADRTPGQGGHAMTEPESPCVTIVSTDAGIGVGGDGGSGGRPGGLEDWGGCGGGAGASGGGWAAGDGLWWVDEAEGQEERASGWGPEWN